MTSRSNNPVVHAAVPSTAEIISMGATITATGAVHLGHRDETRPARSYFRPRARLTCGPRLHR